MCAVSVGVVGDSRQIDGRDMRVIQRPGREVRMITLQPGVHDTDLYLVAIEVSADGQNLPTPGFVRLIEVAGALYHLQRLIEVHWRQRQIEHEVAHDTIPPEGRLEMRT